LKAQVEDADAVPELKSMYDTDEKIQQAIEYGDKLT
jgi:hypothetical protein